MTLIPLDIPPGLNSDDTTFSATGRWADGNNVRFVRGKPQALGGQSSFVSSITGAVRGIHLYNAGVSSGANVTKAAYATDSKLYSAGAGLSLKTDITPVGGWPSTSGHISLAAFGTILLAAPSGKGLFEYTGSGVATSIADAPAAITRMLVTPQRQVLAFGCNEEASGTFNTRCIRGSNLEDHTDWTVTTSNNAFEHVLDDPGAIVGAELVGEYVAVWTETSLFIGQFVGDPSQTYRFDKVGDSCGLTTPGAVAVLSGVAYWMSRDLRFFMWAPGTMPESIPCPIYRDMRDNFYQQYQHLGFAGTVSQYDEVWFYYPDVRDSVTPNCASRYVAVNVKDWTWFRGQQGFASHTDIEGIYSNQFNIVGGVLKGTGTADSFNSIQHHEKAYDGALAGWWDWYIQTADQYFDNSQRRVMVRSFIPDFEEQRASVDLTLFVRGLPREAAITKGPFAISTSTTKKGIRASGKLISVRISSPGASDETGTGFRLGKPLFDIVTLGER